MVPFLFQQLSHCDILDQVPTSDSSSSPEATANPTNTYSWTVINAITWANFKAVLKLQPKLQSIRNEITTLTQSRTYLRCNRYFTSLITTWYNIYVYRSRYLLFITSYNIYYILYGIYTINSNINKIYNVLSSMYNKHNLSYVITFIIGSGLESYY